MNEWPKRKNRGDFSYILEYEESLTTWRKEEAIMKIHYGGQTQMLRKQEIDKWKKEIKTGQEKQERFSYFLVYKNR